MKPFNLNPDFWVNRRQLAAVDVEQKNADNPEAGTKFGSGASPSPPSPKKGKEEEEEQKIKETRKKKGKKIQRNIGAKITDFFQGERREKLSWLLGHVRDGLVDSLSGWLVAGMHPAASLYDIVVTLLLENSTSPMPHSPLT